MVSEKLRNYEAPVRRHDDSALSLLDDVIGFLEYVAVVSRQVGRVVLAQEALHVVRQAAVHAVCVSNMFGLAWFMFLRGARLH